MGKGYHNYMSKKFFHPGNFENIKRVWMAEQKELHDKKRDEETLTQYLKEQDMYQNRALLGDEKAKLGLNFMYDPPPGVQRDREKEDDEPEYKFEWQRKYNAPRESYAKGDDTVRDQPFGIEVRNVRCLKCRKWGHINTDKVCPMYGNVITAEPPPTKQNPGELVQQMAEDGLAFTKKVLSRQNDPSAHNQQLVDSEAEDDEEIAFFLKLTRKEKKKLIKKLEKRRKKEKKWRKKEREGRQNQESANHVELGEEKPMGKWERESLSNQPRDEGDRNDADGRRVPGGRSYNRKQDASPEPKRGRPLPPDRERRCDPSPRRREKTQNGSLRHQSPQRHDKLDTRKRNRSESPKQRRRDRSELPKHKRRDRSESPKRQRSDRSESPKQKRRDRSESPKQQRRDRSESSKQRRRDRSESPKQKRRDRSESPKQQRRDRSESPKQKGRDRSESPKQQRRDRSESPKQRRRDREKRRTDSRD